MRVYRWDLDKTYLQTDFHSVRGLVRSAIEPAEAKQAVVGAPELLRGLCRDPHNRIVFVSGSPRQMREVLERKLRLDGVRFDAFHLKDSVGHLRKGRLRAITHQFGYKLPLLLQDRQGYGRAVQEVLFGDDAEVDALVYAIYADLCSGHLQRRDMVTLLQASGAYPDQIAAAEDALRDLGNADVVERIFIHIDKGRPFALFEALRPRLVPVHSYLQAALVLCRDGHISREDLAAVLTAVLEAEGGSLWRVSALIQDAVRRGLVSTPEALAELEVAFALPLGAALQDALHPRIAALSPPPEPGWALDTAGYLGLMRRFKGD